MFYRWGWWSLCQPPWSATNTEAYQVKCLAWRFFSVGRENKFKLWCRIRQLCDYRVLGTILFYSLQSVPEIRQRSLSASFPSKWIFPSFTLSLRVRSSGILASAGAVGSSSPPRLAWGLVRINHAHLRESGVWVSAGLPYAACSFGAGFCSSLTVFFLFLALVDFLYFLEISYAFKRMFYVSYSTFLGVWRGMFFRIARECFLNSI